MVEKLTAEGNDEHFVKSGQNTTGWVEVIAGSMFSGKSEELIPRQLPAHSGLHLWPSP